MTTPYRRSELAKDPRPDGQGSFAAPDRGSEIGRDDLAVLDLDQGAVGHILAAFLARRAVLDELHVAVDRRHVDLPEGVLDRRRVGLAGLGDGGGDDVDAVIAAIAFGQAGLIIAFGSPGLDEILGQIRVRRASGIQGAKKTKCIVPFAAAPA